jgi:arylsulfatase
MIFSGDETTDVGEDLATPVSDDYGPTGNGFTGAIRWVQIDLGDDSLDHQASPEERLRVAMARQ